MSLRILLADHQPMVRDGLRRILSGDPDFKVVGEVANGQEAVDFISNHAVDIVYLEVAMPGLPAIDACREIRKTNPNVGIIAMACIGDQIIWHRFGLAKQHK